MAPRVQEQLPLAYLRVLRPVQPAASPPVQPQQLVVMPPDPTTIEPTEEQRLAIRVAEHKRRLERIVSSDETDERITKARAVACLAFLNRYPGISLLGQLTGCAPSDPILVTYNGKTVICRAWLLESLLLQQGQKGQALTFKGLSDFEAYPLEPGCLEVSEALVWIYQDLQREHRLFGPDAEFEVYKPPSGCLSYLVDIEPALKLTAALLALTAGVYFILIAALKLAEDTTNHYWGAGSVAVIAALFSPILFGERLFCEHNEQCRNFLDCQIRPNVARLFQLPKLPKEADEDGENIVLTQWVGLSAV